ncbi:exocyst complex component 3 [Thunnus albacares]|uniref:exocyst complex component 3 n=1 Tax=Thunnus albacares TaxID=8236 RepID=UPI001CF68ABC|nr:exocyst complex component 3 [Thunnus albacares]
MVKRWKLGRRSNDSRRPLIENNNNDIQEGGDQAGEGYDNPSTQNIFNTIEEQRLQFERDLTFQELAELLKVAPDTISVGSDTSENGSCCAIRNSGQEKQQSVVQLIQRSVYQHFPTPPAELDKNLQRHLLEVETAVHTELARLAPLFKSKGLIGYLLDCYHRQISDHLHGLLQHISTSKNSFMLLKWVLHTYLSQDLLGAASPQEVDHIKDVDLMLFTELAAKAKDKLLEIVQKEVSVSLEKILQNERSQEGCDSDEAFIQMNVDTIQCIDAMYKGAQTINKTVSDRVQDVCFQELLVFVRRYNTEQTEILRKQTDKAEPDIIHFLKTLQTCGALKQHVQTKSQDIKTSLVKDTVETLQEMEDLTLKLLLEIVADFTESHLKKYFKKENKQFFLLTEEVKTRFPKLLCCQDVLERVMDETYKLIIHLYFKNLVQSNQSKLRRCWGSNVGQQVTQDAELLHHIISDMAPGVKQWNRILLKITETLECEDNDALKIVVASMQQKCITKSCRKDLELLLRWKGLSKREVREVLEALPDHQPKHGSVSWYRCFICC